MTRAYRNLLAATAVLVPVILLLDGPGLPRQLLLGTLMALYLALIARRVSVPPRQIVAAVLIATTGEVLLSVVWGLYSYQFFLIALYVPAGHGLFYAIAADAEHQPLLQKHATPITRAVLVAGTLYAVFTLFAFGDTWGALLWLLSVALIARAPNPLMLSACVVYTMLLEWAGTAAGNWRWAAEVPGLGLASANPPAGVGIFYLILDVVVVWVMTTKTPSGLPDGAIAHN